MIIRDTYYKIIDSETDELITLHCDKEQAIDEWKRITHGDVDTASTAVTLKSLTSWTFIFNHYPVFTWNREKVVM
jgi:hypothetical protein